MQLTYTKTDPLLINPRIGLMVRISELLDGEKMVNSLGIVFVRRGHVLNQVIGWSGEELLFGHLSSYTTSIRHYKIVE